MKTLIKVFAGLSTVLFSLVVLIKFMKDCSWRDAVGILEEFWKELNT